MTTLFILVKGCIWILGLPNHGILERSWAMLKFSLWIVFRILCSCLCKFDANVELRSMHE